MYNLVLRSGDAHAPDAFIPSYSCYAIFFQTVCQLLGKDKGGENIRGDEFPLLHHSLLLAQFLANRVTAGLSLWCNVPPEIDQRRVVRSVPGRDGVEKSAIRARKDVCDVWVAVVSGLEGQMLEGVVVLRPGRGTARSRNVDVHGPHHEMLYAMRIDKATEYRNGRRGSLRRWEMRLNGIVVLSDKVVI